MKLYVIYSGLFSIMEVTICNNNYPRFYRTFMFQGTYISCGCTNISSFAGKKKQASMFRVCT